MGLSISLYRRSVLSVDSVDLLRSRINRIFLDFFQRPVFQKNTTFRKLDLFPSSGEDEEKTPTQLGPLEKVQKNPVNSVQHTPSSESFQVYFFGVASAFVPFFG
jgi:hypothetical protein